jgi:hypothetical protein
MPSAPEQVHAWMKKAHVSDEILSFATACPETYIAIHHRDKKKHTSKSKQKTGLDFLEAFH